MYINTNGLGCGDRIQEVLTGRAVFIVIIVFIVYGPRRLIKVGTIFAALILPICWAIFALIRGAVIGAYRPELRKPLPSAKSRFARCS